MTDVRPHPYLVGITVSDNGTIYRNGQQVRARPGTDGYILVTIREGGTRTAKGAHVLVCETFHGPRPAGMHAAHGNGIRHDNRADNLRWATPTENAADKAQHGTDRRGSRHGRARLTEEQVAEIRAVAASQGRGSQTKLARAFGVSNMTISNIVHGKSWTHVP